MGGGGEWVWVGGWVVVVVVVVNGGCVVAGQPRVLHTVTSMQAMQLATRLTVTSSATIFASGEKRKHPTKQNQKVRSRQRDNEPKTLRV
jgi:hypothetical protein